MCSCDVQAAVQYSTMPASSNAPLSHRTTPRKQQMLTRNSHLAIKSTVYMQPGTASDMAMSFTNHFCCREVLAAVGGVLLASHLLSCSMVLLLALLLGCLQLWCWFEAAQRVEYIRGHRAGAHGYDGALAGHCMQ